ncbi:flagellar basal body L-ring protein FlgH [bacterium]|nr:flagellar basal body L-ring protein FlgH [bacterium]MBT3581715.1 flagellar basal body L-ring protein FlgH [bacterium]MBT7088446.1 flagellar basal body L-ring protein FlgH [bacterium]
MILKTFKYLLIISLFFLFGTQLVFADTLWGSDIESLYSARKANKVGDLITIYISVTSTAVQEAGTTTSKESKISADLFNAWDQVAVQVGADESLRKTQKYTVGGNDQYSGVGQTSRKSQVKAIITATVIEVLSNKNLYLMGEHKVKVNNEIETIRISGIVRPEDITPQNSVYSHQIAKAEISVNGVGVVGSKQNPGVLTKLFNWFF